MHLGSSLKSAPLLADRLVPPGQGCLVGLVWSRSLGLCSASEHFDSKDRKVEYSVADRYENVVSGAFLSCQQEQTNQPAGKAITILKYALLNLN